MLYAFIFSLLFWSQPKSALTQHTQWVIHKNSSLQVAGTSNVKDFTCRLESVELPDTLAFTLSAAAQIIVFKQHKLCIPVDPFDCGNPLIQKDFKRTLKCDTFPNIELQFLDLRLSGGKFWWKEPLQGAISITIGGKAKRYLLDYDLHIYGQEVIELNGQRTLSLADFSLTPPKRLAGLVKIDEEVNVSFRLVLHAINNSAFTAFQSNQ